jgi:hypothetical protein
MTIDHLDQKSSERRSRPSIRGASFRVGCRPRGGHTPRWKELREKLRTVNLSGVNLMDVTIGSSRVHSKGRFQGKVLIFPCKFGVVEDDVSRCNQPLGSGHVSSFK